MTTEPKSKRENVAAKTLLAGTLLLVSAVVITNCFYAGVRHFADQSTWENMTGELGEFRHAVDDLPEVTKDPEQNLIVLGSSITSWGIDGKLLEDILAKNAAPRHVYNLAQAGADPSILRLMADLVHGDLKQRGRKLGVSVIEYDPSLMTQARRKSARALVVQKKAFVAGPSELFREFFRSPDDAASMFALKLFGYRSPSAITNILYQRLYPGQPIKRAPASLTPEEKEKKRRERMEHHLQNRILTCDILNLNMDAGLLDDNKTMIEEIAEVSQKTYVFFPPMNRTWVRMPAEAETRMYDILENLRGIKGVEIIDMSKNPDFTENDFSDTQHLSDEGGTKMTRALAEALCAKK